MNIDVSPDGREIAFDLLGDIYTLPIEGGEARSLVTGPSWDTAPRYSPDGNRILFISDRHAGIDALWTVDRRGDNATLLVSADSQRISAPIWSHDGQEIIAGVGGERSVPKVIRVARGTLDTIRNARGITFTASLSPDRKYAYVGENALERRWGPVVQIDRETGGRKVLTDSTTGAHEYNPIVSRTGRWLGYIRYTPDGRTVLRARRLDGTEDRPLLSLTDGDDPYRGLDDEPVRPNFAFTPGDSAIILTVNGKIWRVRLDGGIPSLIPFRAKVSRAIIPAIQPRHLAFDDTIRIRGIRGPVITRDGRRLVFGAVGKLWVEDLTTGTITRLTTSDDFETYPVLSPDGSSVVYLAYADALQGVPGQPNRRGNIMLVRLAEARTAHQPSSPTALTTELDDYEPPAWFPEGDRILTRGPGKGEYGVKSLLAIDTAGSVPVPVPAELGIGGCAARDMNTRFDVRVTTDGRIYFANCGGDQLNPGNTTIASIKLDGTDRQEHLTIRSGALVVAISPGARHAIFGPVLSRGYAYLVAIPRPGEPPDTISLSDPGARRISDTPITSAAWQDSGTAIVALGPTIAKVDTTGETQSSFHAVRLSLPRFRPSGTLVIRGARLITMAGARGREQVIERGTLVTQDGRIAAIGEDARVPIPDGATVIDGTGLTIIPGLIDVHQHAVGSIRWFPRFVDPNMIDLLSYGVTTAYNPQTRWTEAEAETREIGETEDLPRIRHFYAGRGLSADANGTIMDEESAGQVAFYMDALGVSVMKEYLQPSRLQRRALLKAAAERGMGVTAHTSGLQRTLTLVADGYTGWEHLYMITPFFKDVTEFIAASGVNVTANISTNQATSNYGAAAAVMYTETALDHPGDTAKTFRFSRWAVREREASQRGAIGPFYFVAPPAELPLARHRTGRAARAVARIIDAGGLVSIGAHDPPGIRIHWEMWLINRGGVSAMDVLRAATINGARKIGGDHSLGSLEVGKFADFIVLHGNPLQDIENTVNIKYVVANGVVYDDESMTQLWPNFRRLPRMGWQTQEAFEKMPKAMPLKR